MKRTPLERSSPPRRSSKIRKVGKRAERDQAKVRAFREALARRSPVHCEHCGRMERPRRLDGHHIVGRARGVGWPALHDPEVNGLRVCRWPCHMWLTDWPYAGTSRDQDRIDGAYFEFEAWRAGR